MPVLWRAACKVGRRMTIHVRDTSTLTQSTYETSNLTEEIQAKRSIGKAQKTHTSNKTTPTEESIDFAPVEKTIDYEMNGMPHDFGPYPEY